MTNYEFKKVLREEAVCEHVKYTEKTEDNLWRTWVWNALKTYTRRVVPETTWSIWERKRAFCL